MISFDKAKSIVNKNITALDTESIDLMESGGRVLAEDIRATFDMPRFNNSAMDGFAVRASDLMGASKNKPIILKLIGGIAAGDSGDLSIGQGECTRCMTGAPLPRGADAIVIVEDTSGFEDKNEVKIFTESFSGKNIRYKGEEISNGDILIKKNQLISASEIGILASFGYAKVLVYRVPKIAIFATGDELLEPGEVLKDGKIYNSNLYIFSELVRQRGFNVVMKEVVNDSPESLRIFLSEALNNCDIIISSGGVSMGKYDYVRDIFMELGVEEHFWKVTQKPGKPLFFGTKSGKMIFGLPGNPVSSFLGFMVWVWPVFDRLMKVQKSQWIKAKLETPFPQEPIKTRFLFGKLFVKKENLMCTPSSKIGSHMLSSSLDANCIIKADPGQGDLQKGKDISVKLLPWKNLS